MEEKNSPEEKGIEELLNNFEIELQKNEGESKSETEKIKYYGTFIINGVEFEDLFIMTEKDAEGKTIQHVYSGNSSNEIMSIDEEGNCDIKNISLKKFLGKVDFAKIIKENEREQGRLKGMSEKMTPEEMKKVLEGEKNENSEDQEVEENLQENARDLEITSYKKIKDPHIAEKMPGVFENGEEHGIAYSSKLNRFVIMSKINGSYQINENVEPAKTTMRSIISIDEKGEKVERKVPYALMKLPNNANKEIAVTIGQYGIVDIETVDVLPEQQRLSRPVRVDGQDLGAEQSYQTRYEDKTQGKYYNREIVDGVKSLEQIERDQEGEADFNRTEDDYIPDTEKTWGELMEETGESLPKLIERYNREMEANGKDSREAVETIEYDYGNVNREHQQGTN